MKKNILLICILLTVLLIVNTVTAVPYTNSKSTLENTAQDKKISGDYKLSELFCKFKVLKTKNYIQIKYPNIKEKPYFPTGLLSGVLFVLIGLVGLSVTALIAFLGHISAYFGFSEFGVLLLILATITGITSITFLVGGTILIFL